MNIKHPENSQIPQLRRLWKEAFGDSDKFLDGFFSVAFCPSRSLCVIDGSKVIGALYWFDCQIKEEKYAYVYAVATALDYRGQGVCHKLMESTQLHLEEKGYRAILLVPGNGELFGFYSRMGYSVCSHIKEFQCKKKTEDIVMHPVGINEYAEIRRRLLPEGGVVQERENLQFLFGHAKAFAGEDFLLTARLEGDTLVGMELLGNIEKAPAIVGALKCNKGVFRTVGEDRPFAMCKMLNPGNTTPSYFGLAFD